MFFATSAPNSVTSARTHRFSKFASTVSTRHVVWGLHCRDRQHGLPKTNVFQTLVTVSILFENERKNDPLSSYVDRFPPCDAKRLLLSSVVVTPQKFTVSVKRAAKTSTRSTENPPLSAYQSQPHGTPKCLWRMKSICRMQARTYTYRCTCT